VVEEFQYEEPVARRGTNLSMTADFNQAVVLDAIRRSKQGASRVELFQITGLSNQTISNICRRLLDLELIEEVGKTVDGPGKPRTILRLRPAGNYAVGVHIDPAVITLVILDFPGNVVARSEFVTPTVTSPKAVVAKIASGIEKLIVKSGIAKGRILGLGIASPGPINQKLGVVVDPPNLLGWHRVPLRDELAKATGLPVILDKDVTAAAVGEIWSGSLGAEEDFVFFYTGIGLAAAVVVNGEVVRGVSTNAGEIGGILVGEPRIHKGQSLPGTLGQLATPLALIQEAEDKGVLEQNRVGADPHSIDERFTELVSLAASGNQVARAVIEKSAERIANSISAITNLLDISTLVIGGPFWSRLEPFYAYKLPSLLAEQHTIRDGRSFRVLSSTSGTDVVAVGAACLILDQAFSPKPSNLVFNQAVE
jgi:predicted NBD/HSP70 family sugar kinase